ncbi:flagellar filament capping protein FliD [Massilia sp. TW-1]|uniref:Flagellar hook-associated protein 2 n=1 Tax=Telluria antibiotica TaxID=2717319 RepID=A0ABX0PIR6_9BURK|nr:flagellar filament capping protein FliD [Telluria antibiotica]NIA57169.1 flagellar filament capping protein FliD [Telluria antibiotica]
MSTITAPAYDPTTTAAAMAQKSVAEPQQMINNQTALANATAGGLSTLSSAISAFQTSLSSLTGLGSSMLAQSATFSDTSVGSATAKPLAAAGTYSLFVQQLATASQVSYNNLSNGRTAGGTLKVVLSNETTATTTASFNVDLSAASADTDGDGVLSINEVAAAINRSSGNTGLVSAGVVTIGTDTRLVLTSKNTGAANTVSLDPSLVTDATLKTGLGSRSIVNAAQDAIVLFGGKAGTPMQQSSNTFTNISGVSATFTRAQSATENPITLTVNSDSAGTTKNVQAFVDAYNKLKTTIDSLVDPGSPSSNKAAGIFADDSGIKALQARLVDLVRPNGTLSLAAYGITANRDGTLALDSTRLTKQLASNPNGLDQLIGSSSISSPTGIAGNLNTYLNLWSNSTTGQIQQRTDANTKLQSDLGKRQTDLSAQYDSAYKRYLKQFTDLQALQSAMNSNLSMFDAMFGNNKS